MSNRALLRRQLCSAWQETLTGPYQNQLINSERGLQVHFCHALMREFEDTKIQRRLFIEPTVALGTDGIRCPDLIICNSQKIIGVVEFKYMPRAVPEYTKDLETLTLLTKHASSITLTNERFRGEGASKTYPLADDAILCWAAVYAGTLIDLQHPSLSLLAERFLRLDAVTHESAPATIMPSLDL
jgi:hypothetical protein